VQVFKDFLQVLSILQAVLLGWQTAAAAAMSSIAVTPMSTKAWISLDCVLSRTDEVATNQVFYRSSCSHSCMTHTDLSPQA
jgi:xanthine/uracil permease